MHIKSLCVVCLHKFLITQVKWHIVRCLPDVHALVTKCGLTILTQRSVQAN